MALDFVAGCLGGCAGVLVGHPFDTIKVRLQTQDSRNPIYRGSIHCLTSVIRSESVSGLFKGMSSPMGGVAVINAIVFGVYGNSMRMMSDSGSLSSHFIAGMSSGIVQSFICSPMELVKTRLQLQGQSTKPTWSGFLHSEDRYKGPLDCLKKIAQQDGVRKGVFKGLSCTIARDAPAVGSYFLAYEYLTKVATEPGRGISTVDMFLCGGLSGVVSWIVSYPCDVVKSRVQADGISGERRFNSVAHCIQLTYQQEGLRVFFRGLTLSVIRAFPTNAAVFTVVTWSLRLCQGLDKDPQQDLKISVLRDYAASMQQRLDSVFQHGLNFNSSVMALSYNQGHGTDFSNISLSTLVKLAENRSQLLPLPEKKMEWTLTDCNCFYFSLAGHDCFRSHVHPWSTAVFL